MLPSHPEEMVSFIVARMLAASDPEFARGQRRFFKHEVETYGVRTAGVHQISREVGRAIRGWPLAARNRLMTLLWEDGRVETGALVCYLYRRFSRQCGLCEFKLFERWVDRYVRNWAHCDGVASWLLAAAIANQPELSRRVLPWTSSKNRWKRRAAAVALLQEAKAGRQFDVITQIALRLFPDRDDMVEKGLGWLLKVAYRARPGQVAALLRANRAQASRLTLRYAAEKMTAVHRAQVLG